MNLYVPSLHTRNSRQQAVACAAKNAARGKNCLLDISHQRRPRLTNSARRPLMPAKNGYLTKGPRNSRWRNGGCCVRALHAHAAPRLFPPVLPPLPHIGPQRTLPAFPATPCTVNASRDHHPALGCPSPRTLTRHWIGCDGSYSVCCGPS